MTTKTIRAKNRAAAKKAVTLMIAFHGKFVVDKVVPVGDRWRVTYHREYRDKKTGKWRKK